MEQRSMSSTEHQQHPTCPPRTYILILLALLVFTAINTGAAYLNLGFLNPIIALGIACVNAVLVILFYMHLRYSSRLMKLTFAAGIFTFMILVIMTLTDYISRGWGLW